MLSRPLTCLCLAWVCLAASASGDEVNLQLSAKWPIQLPYEFEDDPLRVRGVRLGLLTAVTDRVRGLDLVLGLSYVMDRAGKDDGLRGNLTALQLTGGVSMVSGEVEGMQLTGFAADVCSDLSGVQLSGIGSFVGGNLKGVQAASFAAMAGGALWDDVNEEAEDTEESSDTEAEDVSDEPPAVAPVETDHGDMVGMQLGGAIAYVQGNLTGLSIGGTSLVAGNTGGVQFGLGLSLCGRDVAGVQIGGITWCRRMTGLQVGLLNWCWQLHGVQIGLINISRSHRLPAWPLINIRF